MKNANPFQSQTARFLQAPLSKKIDAALKERKKQLADAQKADLLKEELRQILLEQVDKLVTALVGEMGIVSGLQDDPAIFGTGGRKYVFLGGGCGFSWLMYRKTKLAKQIDELSYDLKSEVDLAVITAIEKKVPGMAAKCAELGNPLQAHQFQNERYKNTYNWLVADFMTSKGVKNVSVDSRLD